MLPTLKRKWLFGLLFLSLFGTACTSSLYALFKNKQSDKMILRLRLLYHEKNKEPAEEIPLFDVASRSFYTGDALRFEVVSNRSGFLYVLHRDPDGKFHVLYPRKNLSEMDNFVKEYESFTFPKTGKFIFKTPKGKEYLLVALSSKPVPIEQIKNNADEWLPYLASSLDIKPNSTNESEANKTTCEREYMNYGMCQVVYPLKGKRLFYEADKERNIQRLGDANYVLLPHHVDSTFHNYAFVSFHLKHK